jgi:hypothetical protein
MKNLHRTDKPRLSMEERAQLNKGILTPALVKANAASRRIPLSVRQANYQRGQLNMENTVYFRHRAVGVSPEIAKALQSGEWP